MACGCFDYTGSQLRTPWPVQKFMNKKDKDKVQLFPNGIEVCIHCIYCFYVVLCINKDE